MNNLLRGDLNTQIYQVTVTIEFFFNKKHLYLFENVEDL